MMEPLVDIVTVIHNARNAEQSSDLEAQIVVHADAPYRFHRVDNRIDNRGFSRGCNLGASWGTAPVILFLNPDATVHGQFLVRLTAALATNGAVIAGCRFAKPDAHVREWGCKRWVCGAAMGVDRAWFTSVGGFDERYEWGFEDTDLVRQAQAAHLGVVELDLPIHHDSPEKDTPADVEYKRRHFDASLRAFAAKWGWS